MKSKPVTTRLQEDEIEEISKIASEEHLDRASLLRKWILESIETYRMKRAAKLYQLGEVSLAEAATNANVSLWQMMDFVGKNQIRPPLEDQRDIEQEVQW